MEPEKIDTRRRLVSGLKRLFDDKGHWIGSGIIGLKNNYQLIMSRGRCPNPIIKQLIWLPNIHAECAGRFRLP